MRSENDRGTLGKVWLTNAAYQQHSLGLTTNLQLITYCEIHLVHTWFNYASCLKLTNLWHLLCKIWSMRPAVDDHFNMCDWRDANLCLQLSVNIKYAIVEYSLCAFFVHRSMALNRIFKKCGTCIGTCLIILIAMIILRIIFTQRGKVFCRTVCSLKQVCGAYFLHKCGCICWLETCFVCLKVIVKVISCGHVSSLPTSYCLRSWIGSPRKRGRAARWNITHKWRN